MKYPIEPIATRLVSASGGITLWPRQGTNVEQSGRARTSFVAGHAESSGVGTATFFAAIGAR